MPKRTTFDENFFPSLNGTRYPYLRAENDFVRFFCLKIDYFFIEKNY